MFLFVGWLKTLFSLHAFPDLKGIVHRSTHEIGVVHKTATSVQVQVQVQRVCNKKWNQEEEKGKPFYVWSV